MYVLFVDILSAVWELSLSFLDERCLFVSALIRTMYLCVYYTT